MEMMRPASLAAVAAAWPLFEGERITLLEMVEFDGEVERMKKDDVGPGAANAASGGDSQKPQRVL